MVRGPHAEDVTQPSVHRSGVELVALKACSLRVLPLNARIAVVSYSGGYTATWCGKGGCRFNDSTGDGWLPQELAQDRVSQHPRGCLCNNPYSGGKITGAAGSCYGSAIQDEASLAGHCSGRIPKAICHLGSLRRGLGSTQRINLCLYVCLFCFCAHYIRI